MNSQNVSLNELLIRQTAVSVIFHGLMDILISKKILLPSDISAIRTYAMDLSIEMQRVTETNVHSAGIRVGEEIERFFGVLLSNQ